MLLARSTYLCITGSVLAVVSSSAALAQVISPDGSLPTTVMEDTAAQQFTVTGGLAQGSNLFHSFETFSSVNHSVLFNLSGDSFGSQIERIFSRVTGNNASDIDGSLSIFGGNSPDLFLLNPNGIIFGPNARLNLPGSFVGTTAESIDFAGGVSFSSISPQTNPLLSISIPTGLQFGSNPGAISVLGTGSNILPRNIPIAAPALPDPAFPAKGLSLAPGNTLALLGGPIQFDGGEVQSLSLPLPDGSTVPLGGLQLELGSIGTGQVGLTKNPVGGWTVDYSEVQGYQDISFSNQSWLNNGGINPSSISITGRNISGEGGSTISLLNWGAETNGDITLRASEQFQFSGLGLQTSDIENSAFASVRAGGDVNLYANNLTLADGSRLQAGSYGAGDSGDLKVEVNGDIHLNGLTDISNPVPNITGINTANTAQGAAGEVRVQARNITIDNGALLSAATFGTGASNNVTLNVEDSIVVRGVNPVSSVNSNIASTSFSASESNGLLKINTTNLEVLDGGVIITSTFGPSDAGEIVINASDSVRVGGFSTTSSEQLISRIASDAVEGGLGLDSFAQRLPLTGDAGSVRITTPKLEVFDQGKVSVTNRGIGGAGELRILAETLSLSSQAEILAETESGLDGDIRITASESIRLAGQSNITASSNGDQQGGNINIETQHLVAVPNTNSDIRADAANSLGGNIMIEATSILGFNLTAPASEQTNDITASSALGTASDGTIEVSQPNTDLASGLAALNNDLAQSENTPVANACSAASASFASRGRGGLPLGPNNLLHDTLQVAGEHDPINRAIALRHQGFYAQAQAILQEEAETLGTSPDLTRQAIALRQLGITQTLLGQYKQSQTTLERSLTLARSLEEPNQISATLMSLGNLARVTDNASQARSHYQNALEHHQPNSQLPSLTPQILANQLSLALAENRETTAQSILNQLMAELSQDFSHHQQLETRLNVAASLLNHQRSEMVPDFLRFLHQTLEAAKAKRNNTQITYALGHIGQAYEQNRQWDKAQQLSEAALQLAQSQSDFFQEYQWAWQLGRISQARWERSGEMRWRAQAQSAYQIAVQALKPLRSDLAAVPPALQFSFRSQVEPVYRNYVSLLLVSDTASQPDSSPSTVSSTNLQTALQVIETLRVAELDSFFQDACSEITPKSIETLDASAAVIYPIVLEDRIEMIISRQGELQHYTVPVSTETVEQAVKRFRQTLVTRSRRNYQQSGEQLYDWFVSPVVQELQQTGIETLIFVPDGPLQNVPMAALFDGQQYLFEQFNIAIAPSLQLLPSQTASAILPQSLVAGITQQNQGFSQLPHVKQEIEKIQSLFPGQRLINESFTSQSLKQSLVETQTPIIHIATHGQFSSNASETFILAWDEQISIEELHEILRSRDRQNLSPTELLVLSACETAAGDDTAALGLAGIAVRAGARSTLASLWSINDQSTAFFMETFYQQLAKPSATKSSALREAQLAMLEHPIYSHPYYWSAFVLMGNWQ